MIRRSLRLVEVTADPLSYVAFLSETFFSQVGLVMLVGEGVGVADGGGGSDGGSGDSGELVDVGCGFVGGDGRVDNGHSRGHDGGGDDESYGCWRWW